MRWLIPKGVSVNLPEVSERYEGIQQEVIEVFKRWGFRRVRTPIFEYYDDIYREIDDSLKGAVVKLVERETGRVIVLRPDFTPQVARIAATLLRDIPRPLRIFYHGSVFRWSGEPSGGKKQNMQVGLELIGLDKPEACAELVAISKEVMDTFGVKNYTVVISNVSFLREVLSPFPPEVRRKIAFALARKDMRELEGHLAGFDMEPERRELVMKLPELVGERGIMEDIRRIFPSPGVLGYLRELEEVLSALDSYGLSDRVILDLSEIRGMVYHKGFFFEVFAEGVGRRVAVGGRYDGLMEAYGKPEPAMGFAFSLEELYRAIEVNGRLPEDSPVDVLVVDLSRVKLKGMEIARALRAAGLKVARDIIERELEGSISYARVHGIRVVVVITEELKAASKVRVLDIKGGREQVVREAELIKAILGGSHG